MKWLQRFILVFLLIVGAWWLLQRLDVVPSVSDLFKEEEVVIDRTDLIIRDIRPLAQMVTLSAYDEIVVDSVIAASAAAKIIGPLVPFIVPASDAKDKVLVMVGKTVSHAGVDLEKINREDIRVSGDTLYLTLPHAEVLDVILNPSDIDVFIEQGDWDNATIAHMKNSIRSLAAKKVRERNLLPQAEKKAVSVLNEFFLSAGFDHVIITMK